jgi:death on curing protein
VQNHPFADGNMCVGHSAAESFLKLNGFELVAAVDDAETIVVGLAAGKVDREARVGWIRGHLRPMTGV